MRHRRPTLLIPPGAQPRQVALPFSFSLSHSSSPSCASVTSMRLLFELTSPLSSTGSASSSSGSAEIHDAEVNDSGACPSPSLAERLHLIINPFFCFLLETDSVASSSNLRRLNESGLSLSMASLYSGQYSKSGFLCRS